MWYDLVLDPSMVTSYKMEVLRNPKFKTRPLFRVSSEDGFQVGFSPNFFYVIFLCVY